VLDGHIKKERLIEMPCEKNPNESDSVLSVKWVNFPEHVSKRILEESCDVLECSPFLGHISRLSCCLNELVEIPICFLGKSSKLNV
jgi:hypothetical protein